MKKLLTSIILAAAGLFAANTYADHRPTDDYFRLTSVIQYEQGKMPTTGLYLDSRIYLVLNPYYVRQINNERYQSWIRGTVRGIHYYHTHASITGGIDKRNLFETEWRGSFSTITINPTRTSTSVSISVSSTITTSITSTIAYQITQTAGVLELERVDKSHTLRAELDTIAELEKISHRADIDLFDFGIGCFESRIGCTPDHYREALRGRDRVIFGTALEHLEECIVDAFGGGIIHATKDEVLNLALYVRGGIMYHRRQDVNGQMMIILKYRQSNFHRNTYEKVCQYLQTRDWNGRIPAGIRGADIVQNAHRTYERH